MYFDKTIAIDYILRNIASNYKLYRIDKKNSKKYYP